LGEKDLRAVFNWLAHDFYLKARAPQIPPIIPSNLLMHGGGTTLVMPDRKKIYVRYSIKMASDPRLLNINPLNPANSSDLTKRKLASELEKKLNAKPWEDYILVDKEIIVQIIEALK